MYPLFYLLKKVVISCLIFLYFGLGTDTKKEQRKLLKVLCLQGLHGTPRARMREEKNGEVRPGLYMRERERESIQIFGTTKYFAIFLSSFLLSVLNDSATGTQKTTPLL